jgi:hypothetical protein
MALFEHWLDGAALRTMMSSVKIEVPPFIAFKVADLCDWGYSVHVVQPYWGRCRVRFYCPKDYRSGLTLKMTGLKLGCLDEVVRDIVDKKYVIRGIPDGKHPTMQAAFEANSYAIRDARSALEKSKKVNEELEQKMSEVKTRYDVLSKNYLDTLSQLNIATTRARNFPMSLVVDESNEGEIIAMVLRSMEERAARKKTIDTGTDSVYTDAVAEKVA